jgi:hypothetical protein
LCCVRAVVLCADHREHLLFCAAWSFAFIILLWTDSAKWAQALAYWQTTHTWRYLINKTRSGRARNRQVPIQGTSIEK